METISVQELALDLEMNNNKDTLCEMWYVLIKDFLSKNISKSWDGQSAIDITRGNNLEKIPPKTEMAIICANFYTNKAAVLDFYESLPEQDKKVMEKATWQEFINYKELEEIYGQPVIYVEIIPGNKYSGLSYRLVKDKFFKRW